jgi:NAD(P)-dependent dehydrogenase (short-subunit alcohol dehydrogenase family)
MPKERKLQPRQRQQQRPGREHKMRPRPKAQGERYRASEKLRDKMTIITGVDSGIGRAVAIAFAKEGADVAVIYLEEEKDANETKRNPQLLDYSSTKGAITTFTRSLSQALDDKAIRVNGVAPGPIWTPLIPASFPSKDVETFGSDVPLGRPGQPEENRAELRVPRI